MAPLPSGDSGARLAAISCVTTTDWVAIGAAFGAEEHPIAEVYNGVSWSAVEPALPAADELGSLTGVSCPSASDCVAVGQAQIGGTGGAVELAYGFNGTAWTPKSTPATVGDQLSAVSCTSATLCWAVGQTTAGTLAQRFNGSGWTVATTPSDAAGALEGVSCPTASFCMAVGQADRNNPDGAPVSVDLVGGAWTTVPVALTGVGPAYLGSVSCVSATACTAVNGFSQFGNYAAGFAAARFNGAKWTQQPFPVSGHPLVEDGAGARVRRRARASPSPP